MLLIDQRWCIWLSFNNVQISHELKMLEHILTQFRMMGIMDVRTWNFPGAS
jgi:hypothetical protein